MKIPVKDKIYIIGQLVIFMAYPFDISDLQFMIPENIRWIALVGAGVGGVLVVGGIIQLKTNISPFPSPKKGARLVTSGFFAFARHPIYSGVLFMAFGLALWWTSGYKLIVSILLMVLFYAKTSYEEKRLQERFPDYVLYKRETGRFFPKFRWRI